MDIEERAIVKTWEDPECLASEPLFVPDPSGSSQEDGVLVFVCLGIGDKPEATHLVVLDTQLEEMGRFSAPVRTMVGIHGIWLPDL